MAGRTEEEGLGIQSPPPHKTYRPCCLPTDTSACILSDLIPARQVPVINNEAWLRCR